MQILTHVNKNQLKISQTTFMSYRKCLHLHYKCLCTCLYLPLTTNRGFNALQYISTSQKFVVDSDAHVQDCDRHK